MPPLENGFLHATNSSPKSHWVNADKSVFVKQYYALARGYQVPPQRIEEICPQTLGNILRYIYLNEMESSHVGMLWNSDQ